jgi:hypothetical protein
MSTGKRTVEPSQKRAARADLTEQTPAPTQEQERHTAPDETELFPPASEPSYFGTGSYGTGGWNVGRIGEINPRGGYGSFTDAGGFGANTLYGEEVAENPPNDESAPASAEAGAVREAGAPGTGLTTDAGAASSERYQLIAVAAYYLAERRGYQPGHELDDWLAAEREIEGAIGSSGASRVGAPP